MLKGLLIGLVFLCSACFVSSGQQLSLADNQMTAYESALVLSEDIISDEVARDQFQHESIRLFWNKEIDETEFRYLISLYVTASNYNENSDKDTNVQVMQLCSYPLPDCALDHVILFIDIATIYSCSAVGEFECPEGCFAECGIEKAAELLEYFRIKFYYEVIEGSGCSVYQDNYPHCEPFKQCMELNAGDEIQNYCADINAITPGMVTLLSELMECLDGCCCTLANP